MKGKVMELTALTLRRGRKEGRKEDSRTDRY
jgi:hypothetical protein